MNAIPLIRAAALSPYLETLASLGAPLEPFLTKVRLPPPQELDPNVLVPYQQVLDFLAASGRATGIRELPALAARRAGIDHLGSWGQLLGRTKTLGDLLRTTVDSSWMHTNGARWWLADSGADVVLCQQFDRRLDLGRGEVLVALLGYALGSVRRVVGAAFTPSEITVTRPLPLPTGCLGLERSVRVTGVTSIRIPRRLLGTPTPYLRRLAAETERGFAIDLAASAPADDFLGSVRQALAPLAGSSQMQIGTLSDITRIPVRTLQRRLADAGTSFSAVTQEIRFARAVRRMSDPSVKLIDVAFEVGFSDPAHFTRAFRRWAGVSPRAFRRACGGPAAAVDRRPGEGPHRQRSMA